RDAADAFLEVLDAEKPMPETVVVHCFTGDGATLRQYLRRGYNIGITGWICDERRGLHLRALVKEIARDRLLVETDAPFLTPRDLKPKPAAGRNEPAFLPHVLRTIARCRGEDPEALAERTTANALRVFPRLTQG
ncbi:MAG TPA: TatD family hydrolase, partial [Nannocystis sp.]